MEQDIYYLAAIGASLIVCMMADFANEAETLELSEKLNRYGRLACEYGLKVGYPNHTKEFLRSTANPFSTFC